MARVTQALSKYFQLIASQAKDTATGAFGFILSVNVENWGEAGGAVGGTSSSGGVTQTNPAPGTPIEVSALPLAIPTGDPLSTLTPSTQREGYWFFENQSTNTLLVVLDNGTDGVRTVLSAAPAGTVGGQGGTFGSADTGPHLGRIRVFGPAQSNHALRAQ